MNYDTIFDLAISDIKRDNNYRIFKEINRDTSCFPIVKDKNGREIVIWCSNDYLGFGIHPAVVKSAVFAMEKRGVGSGGTRNIGGTHSAIVNLENSVSKLNQKPASLIFTSGYVANVGAISAITKMIPDIIVFSDAKNHSSIIAGIKVNCVKRHIFRHNDMAHLEELITQYPFEKPKIIIFEGVYSMDGSIGKVTEICKIAKKYNALTYIDEVHAVGLYGDRGAGIVNLLNEENNIDIIQGNFAKGLGVIGGYVSGKANIIDAIRSTSGHFIFTTSLPPAICEAAIKAVEIAMSPEGAELRLRHQEVVRKVKEALVINSESHIIPIIIGDPKKTETISHNLYHKGIYVQHINYPTVEKGTERLRITPTPYHTDEMIEDLKLKLQMEL